MTIIHHTEAPVFDAGGTTVHGYAAPSRGSTELSLWRLELAPGSTSPLHELSREEVFLGLEGEAVAEIAGVDHPIGPGDCLIVPPGTELRLRVPGGSPFRAVACLPVGGQATLLPGGPSAVPPWAR